MSKIINNHNKKLLTNLNQKSKDKKKPCYCRIKEERPLENHCNVKKCGLPGQNLP